MSKKNKLKIQINQYTKKSMIEEQQRQQNILKLKI